MVGEGEAVQLGLALKVGLKEEVWVMLAVAEGLDEGVREGVGEDVDEDVGLRVVVGVAEGVRVDVRVVGGLYRGDLGSWLLLRVPGPSSQSSQSARMGMLKSATMLKMRMNAANSCAFLAGMMASNGFVPLFYLRQNAFASQTKRILARQSTCLGLEHVPK